MNYWYVEEEDELFLDIDAAVTLRKVREPGQCAVEGCEDPPVTAQTFGRATPGRQPVGGLCPAHAKSTANRLGLIFLRMKGAIDSGALKLEDSFIYPSTKPHHYHLMLRLSRERPSIMPGLFDEAPGSWAFTIYKNALRGRLLDDPYRSQQDAIRRLRNVTASLLIAPERRRSYPREPDHVCKCHGKHDTITMGTCPVALFLRGNEVGAEYFGKPTACTLPVRFGRFVL